MVDDDPTVRLKLTAAAKALGHAVENVANGEEALSTLASDRYDLILLDLMMPGMDGYAVLERLAGEDALRDIPVLVISGVEDSRDIARAIELGADDVLPKAFDPVLFRTRINASLRRWRLRQAEAEYLAEVERLGAAAQIVEKTSFNPSMLGLDEIARRKDDLAGFARVFLEMADHIYVRETNYRRRIGLLLGGLLLILSGTVKGTQPSLSRMLAQTGLDPLALAAWSLAAGAGIALLACLVAGQVPRFTRASLLRLGTYAVFACALPRILVLTAAAEVPAMIISILLAAETIAVFAFAAIVGQERPNARRLFGLTLGLVGVVAILVSGRTAALAFPLDGILLILAATLGYASGKIVLSSVPETDTGGPLADAAVILVIAAATAFCFALGSGTAVPVGALWNASGLVVLALGAVGVVCHVVLLVNVRITGAVFTSQSAYTATAAGVVWSMLLLGERMTLWAGGALMLLFLGLLLVMPRDREEDLDTVFAKDPELDAARARLGL